MKKFVLLPVEPSQFSYIAISVELIEYIDDDPQSSMRSFLHLKDRIEPIILRQSAKSAYEAIVALEK
ncbi:hypothetical protein LJB87_00940 [Alistipes sp. OttesenSCG-928-L06]|nr:hypothetical protein [Alistipes sp. OttesenSCG-928-L06]